MQSSMLITYNDCTYSWAAFLERALLHSPALWGRRAGGRWMVLLIGRGFYQSDASNETTAYNGGCHSKKRGGAMWDLWFLCQTSLHCSLCVSVWQSWIYSRQTERGLSVLMKAYLLDAEYTLPTHGEETSYWLTKDAQRVHRIMVRTMKAFKGNVCSNFSECSPEWQSTHEVLHISKLEITTLYTFYIQFMLSISITLLSRKFDALHCSVYVHRYRQRYSSNKDNRI